MKAILRIAAVTCALVMILLVFQSLEVRATKPDTGANEYNHALASNGATATASGSNSPTVPGNAIDNDMATYWQSSTTTGWLSVRFASKVSINEVHIHFLTTVYSSLSLYLDTSGNGAYESAEKVWSTTSNTGLNVIRVTTTSTTLGMEVTIDLRNGSNKPKIAEFEAYLRYDTDGDGLTNDQESGTTYFQDVGAGGLPQAIPDDGVNESTTSVFLTQFYGDSVRALSNFTVDHPGKTDLSASIGYWNGSAWIDRYVWDPGKRLLGIRITQPSPGYTYSGTVTVVAFVDHPEFTSKVEYRIDGTLSGTVTAPIGNEYRWTWTTSGDGYRTVNVTQHDAAGARDWDQVTVKTNNLAPSASWVSPASGATVSGTVTVKVTATDYWLIRDVKFYVDDTYQASDNAPDPGTNDFTWAWNTAGWPNGAHTLKAEVTDRLILTTTITRGVTTNNDPTVSITYPTNGLHIYGVITVTANAASSSSTISKVEFYVDGFLRSTDTTGPSPYTWGWDTGLDLDGTHTLDAKAYRKSDSKSATHSIKVTTANGNGCGTPPCPESPMPSEPADGESSAPSHILGILSSEWPLGEFDSGTRATLVVDLVAPQSAASAAENASRIVRPAFPLATFTTYLKWRLVVRDWVAGTMGNATSFTLRIEVRSDPTLPSGRDTDRDGILDGVEVTTWHTLPVARDSDLDGLSDDYEIAPHTLTLWTNGASSIASFTTDPATWDTDGDGLSDAQERGSVTTGQSKVIGEVGQVSGITGTCTSPGATKVYLRNKYTNPVVIAEPPTRVDTSTGVLRIRSVTDHTFEACFQEWAGDALHAGETASYLVLEAGNHVLPDGSVVEAGTSSVTTTYARVSFRETFTASPIVLAQTQSYADAKTVAVRIKGVSATGFDAYLRTNPIGSHSAEAVGYVAITPQADPASLATWTRGTATASSGATSGQVAFAKSFASTPRFLTWFGTEGATADVSVRLSSITNTSASYVRETTATPGAETLHYFAFAGSMNLTARMTTKPTGTGSADTDADGLSDGADVSTHGSNPTLKDTDADGIPDNVEVTDRTITIPVNGTAKTFTFKTSPTSDDTDADGLKDPEELAGILDHRVLFYDMQTLADSAHLRDLSGNGYVGTLYGPTNVTGGVKIGNSLNFDGTNDKVTATIPGMSGLTTWSFSLWFQWDNAGGSTQHLIAFGQSSDVTIYMAKGNRTLLLKVTDGYGAVVRHVILATFTTAQATQAHYVAVTFDGTSLRAVVDNTAKGPWTAAATRIRADGVRIGTSTAETSNFFDGKLDEVQAWDRAIANAEALSYYNVTNAATGYKARLDFDARTSAGDLFDFSGTSHTGTATGTTAVEGRIGFARRLVGGTDGIVLASSSGISITSSTGATLDILVLASSMPSQDASLVARVGSFYLNLSSDGVVRWSLHNAGTVASPLPLPLNRWVRVTATASASTAPALALYLDGVSVPSGSATSFPSTTNAITIGYANGQVHLSATVDEFTLHTSLLSANTIGGLGPAGIRLNPNATDTDFDGLADGQELFVRTFRTSNRYPLPEDSSSNVWFLTATPLQAPAWAIRSVDLMTGFTHPDMAQASGSFGHMSPSTSFPYFVIDRALEFRASGSNAGQANNFTSYDLLQKPSGSGSSWLVPSDFVTLSATAYGWFVSGKDQVADGKRGQLEYSQLQLTMRSFPNRADTDSDGLNDSEELNLGSDGFTTDPWKADTDGDGLADTEYSVKGTDPTNPDTDRDGYRDNVDRFPLADAFVQVLVSTTRSEGSDEDSTPLLLEPFVAVTYDGERSFTKYPTQYAWIDGEYVGLINHYYSFNVPDDVASVQIKVEAWDYDSDNSHDPLNVASSNSTTLTYATGDYINWFQWFPLTGSTNPRVVNLKIYVSTVTPTRNPVFLVVPSDYAGVYNVTSHGLTTSRRYVGEPKFVALFVNLTDAAYGYSGEKQTWLVPRSVFFDTYLSTRLNKASNMTGTWLSDSANAVQFSQNSSAGPGTSALDGSLTAELDVAEWTTMIDWLKKNASGGVSHTYLRVDWESSVGDYFFLLGLPDAVVQLASYAPLPNTPSTAYKWDYRPLWQRIWDGTIGAALMWIASGFVAAGNFLVNLPTMLAQLGAWLWAGLVAAGQVVASAVQAAAKVLGQFVNWIVNMAVSVLTNAIAGLLSSVKFVFDNTIGRFVQELETALASVDTIELANKLASLLELLSIIVIAVAMIPVAIRVASIAIKAVTAGVSWLVETAISEGVAEFIVRVLMGIAFSLATTALFTAILETMGWVEDTTVAFFRTLGIAATAIYAVSKVVFKLYESLFVKTATDVPIVQRYKGFALAVLGLLLVFIGSSTYAQGGTGRLAADLAGFAFQAYGFWLFMKSSKDPLVQIGDFVAPMGSAVEHGVTVLAPPVSAAKITFTWNTGGYN